MVNDPIGDLLIRIKNGGQVQKPEVKLPCSRTKEAVLKVLLQSGYIGGYAVSGEGVRKELVVKLKYNPGTTVHFIKGVRRVSTPGCHKYIGSAEIKRTIRGQDKLGIISTSRGIVSHYEAQKQKLGGEFLALVW